MYLTKSSVELWRPEGFDLKSIYKHVERCGRICYKSFDRITDNSYVKFTDNLKSRSHFSVFEHGTVYLSIPETESAERYIKNKFSDVAFKDGVYAVTTNMRVILENNWIDDLEYMTEPLEHHLLRYTFHVIAPVGITREWNRHKTLSPSEQSTRYCNYTKDKFNNELSFCVPDFIELLHYNVSCNSVGNNEVFIDGIEERLYNEDNHMVRDYLYGYQECENTYFRLINEYGLKPEQARGHLSLDVTSEVAYTGTYNSWMHFLDLRCGKGAHPEIIKLANQVKEILKNENNLQSLYLL